MANKLLFGFILFFTSVIAQVSENSAPWSDDYLNLHRPTLVEVANPDKPTIDKALGKPMLAAQLLSINVNITQEASIDSIENKTIYRLSIQSQDAKALNLYFDQFYLPKGDQLFLYSPDKAKILGAFTHKNNRTNLQFATDYTLGDQIIIEYNHLNSNPIAQLHINELGYFLRDTEKTDASQPCEVNINCSEGTHWQDEKKGVVRLLIKKGNQTFWCSGSLVNNTSTDCTPYILSADHCTNESSVSDYNSSIVYFNYESSSCEGASSTTINTITGFERIANGPFTGGSDFVLLKLTETIPDNYNPYFNGWKIDEASFSSGAAIHHPAGDIKKISQYATILSSITLNSGLTAGYWKVNWVGSANGHGITEEGSSGGPLFNEDGLIIGTLTGGNSFCATPTEDDYFGKFSKHWSSNGSTATQRLKDWLDPSNTGVTELKGTYRPCTNYSESLSASQLKVWPNPSKSIVNIEFETPFNKPTQLKIIDLIGQVVYESKFSTNKLQIPVDQYSTGTYIIQLSSSKFTINQTVIINR